MNDFDDLIDQLKEENLLEENVNAGETLNAKVVRNDFDEAVATTRLSLGSKTSDSLFPKNEASNEKPATENLQISDVQAAKQIPGKTKTVSKIDFFRRRATEGVANLQMVEHVFSGVERQQKKMIPKPYDDLKVKKALHTFLQVCEKIDSSEHAQTEFELMQETESWYSALSHRDKQLSITNLRRYCETAKPSLSAPALLALARFYRNSPYSEAVRSKFDLIVTRLFSKDLPAEKREQTFERDDLINHLSELYAEWESVSLFSGEEEEAGIVLTAFKFEDFMGEVAKAESFDELIRNDYFNRLRGFKESAGEKFFSPLVTATAVECNIKTGNRYVELLERERDGGTIEKLENKYGFLHDQVISDATSKSLQLVELLKNKADEADKIKNAIEKNGKDPKISKTTAKTALPENTKKTFFGVNKWLAAAAAAVLVVSVSLYVWSTLYAAPEKISQNVKTVNIENSTLKEYVKDARVGNDTFFAVVLPAWNKLTPEKKEEFLKKIVSLGADKGFKNVHLLDVDGKSVGTAAGDSVEVRN